MYWIVRSIFMARAALFQRSQQQYVLAARTTNVLSGQSSLRRPSRDVGWRNANREGVMKLREV